MRSARWLVGVTALVCCGVGCGDNLLFGGGAGAGTAAGTAAGGGGGSATGTAGTGGVGGTATGMGGAGGVGGGAAGTCSWNGAPCGPSHYCFAPGCGEGTCQAILPNSDQKADHAPVCGCNGISYWNDSIAASHGMSVQQAGPCPTAVPCHPSSNPCGPRLHCNRRIEGIASCAPSPPGNCWGMPQVCGPAPVGRQCWSIHCDAVCQLILDEEAWYEDATCS